MLADLSADALTLPPCKPPRDPVRWAEKKDVESEQVCPRSQSRAPAEPVSHMLVQGPGPLLRGSLSLMKEL